MEQQFILPSFRSRVTMLLKIGVNLVAIYVLYLAAMAYVHARYVWPRMPCTLIASTRVIVVVAAIVLAGLAIAAGRYGWRIWRSGQVPAPGTAVFFKSTVYVGWWQRMHVASMAVAVMLCIWLLANLLRFFVFASGGPHLFSIHACATNNSVRHSSSIQHVGRE